MRDPAGSESHLTAHGGSQGCQTRAGGFAMQVVFDRVSTCVYLTVVCLDIGGGGGGGGGCLCE